jgi:hypothetical protein
MIPRDLSWRRPLVGQRHMRRLARRNRVIRLLTAVAVAGLALLAFVLAIGAPYQ